jgi:hypothetical protein
VTWWSLSLTCCSPSRWWTYHESHHPSVRCSAQTRHCSRTVVSVCNLFVCSLDGTWEVNRDNNNGLQLLAWCRTPVLSRISLDIAMNFSLRFCVCLTCLYQVVHVKWYLF